MKKKSLRWLWITGLVLLALLSAGFLVLPQIGAALILHPMRRPITAPPPPGCQVARWEGHGITLKGWQGEALGERRGSVVYLHGVADNRCSGSGVLERFRKAGFDVLAYDSRAHGESGGDAATYGFHEKEDLRSVIASLKPGPVFVIGSSLGAAVALQTAALEPRISGVVAAESFADFRTVVNERAPAIFTRSAVARSIALAEKESGFQIDAVSPAAAARSIQVPVLLIHGDADSATPPWHSQRIFEALQSPKRLILVPGAEHNGSLNGSVWKDIEEWIHSIASGNPLPLK